MTLIALHSPFQMAPSYFVRRIGKAVAAASLAALASCTSVVPGDFCDVYEPVMLSEPTAQIVVRDDRPAAVAIAANELYHGRVCGG